MTTGRSPRPAGRDNREHRPPSRKSSLRWSGLVCLILLAAQPSQAQGLSAPSNSYYNVFNIYYEGDYVDALKLFQNEARGAIKTAQSHWIDSICYQTMCGECYYQMGMHDQALQHYERALKLYIAFSDWMTSCQFDPTVRPALAGQVKNCPWGASARKVRLGSFPRSVLSAQGRINNNAVVQMGGVAQPPKLFPIDATEIVRCTALAMRRRMEILGPLCAQDPLSSELIVKLGARPGPPNHWSEAWIDVQLGLAYLSGGKIAEGKAALFRSLVAGGEFDHPLTSTALLELGKIALGEGDFVKAEQLLAEASISAFQHEDYGALDIIEESFRHGLLAHMMAHDNKPMPALDAALAWVKTKRLRMLNASLLLLSAESQSNQSAAPKAVALLAEAQRQMVSKEMFRGKMGARLHFLNALVNYQLGRVPQGNEALDLALKFQRTGSLWMFQIGLCDSLVTQGTLRARAAMDMYSLLLRDPTAADWTYRPHEALSKLAFPHPLPYEHWFYVALERKEAERALEISDLAKRHRYLSSLGAGARLLSLRWVLEGPEEALDQPAVLERQRMLARYPAYAALSQQAKKIQTELRRLPAVTSDEDVALKQQELFKQLADVSQKQETILHELAVRRESATIVFPPVRSAKELQDSLQPGQVVISYFATTQFVHAFILSNDKNDYATWQLSTHDRVFREVAALLRGMNNLEGNKQVRYTELADDAWKTQARKVMIGMFGEQEAKVLERFSELIVIPDGVLWYVPYEALQVADANKSFSPLVSKMQIRLLPLAAMAYTDRRPRKPSMVTAAIAGSLYPGVGAEVTEAAVARLGESVARTVKLRKPLPAPGYLYSTLFDRVYALDEILLDKGPLAWSPLRYDEGAPGSSVESWLALPFPGPEQVILPEMRTAGENSLYKQTPTIAGHDVFLSVCGMMSTGARTILMSRWRTGGASSLDMAREFAQELPYMTAAQAWQRSVLLAMDTPLDPEAEPRLLPSANLEAPRGANPFWWGGYMLVDTGTQPAKEDPESRPAPEAGPNQAEADKPAADAGGR